MELFGRKSNDFCKECEAASNLLYLWKNLFNFRITFFKMDSISQNKNAKDFLSIRTVGGTQKEKETMSKMLKHVRENLQKVS